MRWVVLASAYVILWFLALQILLPIGVKSGEGNGAAEFGSGDPGAPRDSRIGWKIAIATVVAGAIWSVFYALVLLKVVDV